MIGTDELNDFVSNTGMSHKIYLDDLLKSTKTYQRKQKLKRVLKYD